MKVSIGSDHRGVDVRKRIAACIEKEQGDVTDHGTDSTEGCDYPDIASAVATSVGQSVADRGILVCGSGIGMSIAANKVAGVRAALCHDLHGAEMSRKHNDSNVLCLSADLLRDFDDDRLCGLIKTWLTTEFEGGRHQRRVDKINSMDGSPSCNELA